LLFVTKFAYNNNWHNVIKTSSFTILYRNENVSKWKDQIQEDSEKKMSTTRFKILKITILRNQLYKRLKKTKENQIKYYDEKHIFRIFNVENKILLNFKNIHTSRWFKKLDYKYYESFEMQNLVKKQTYKFNLSHTFRIHNVFHVSLLKSFKKRFDEMITSFSIMINEKKHDEVKLILNNKLYQKRLNILSNDWVD
jgi:hypothetical protein